MPHGYAAYLCRYSRFANDNNNNDEIRQRPLSLIVPPDAHFAMKALSDTLLDRSTSGTGQHRQVGGRARKVAAARAHLVALVFGDFDADFVIAAVGDVV